MRLFGYFLTFPKEKTNLEKTGKKLAFLRFRPFPKENGNFGRFFGFFPKLYNKENNSIKVQNFCNFLKNTKKTQIKTAFLYFYIAKFTIVIRLWCHSFFYRENS